MVKITLFGAGCAQLGAEGLCSHKRHRSCPGGLASKHVEVLQSLLPARQLGTKWLCLIELGTIVRDAVVGQAAALALEGLPLLQNEVVDQAAAHDLLRRRQAFLAVIGSEQGENNQAVLEPLCHSTSSP